MLSARRPARQMAQLRRRLSEAHGAVFELAGRSVAAFPTPSQLLRVRSFPGLNDTKLSRLHAVAAAAQDGWLDATRLQALGPEAAAAMLRRLPGIGPFYADLVVVRAVGFPDVLAASEPRLRQAVGELYQLGGPASPTDLGRVAEAWRPRRTWAAVLVRAARDRLTSEADHTLSARSSEAARGASVVVDQSGSARNGQATVGTPAT